MKSDYSKLEDEILQQVIDSLRGMILVSDENLDVIKAADNFDPALSYASTTIIKSKCLEIANKVLGDEYGKIKSIEVDDSDLRDLKFKIIFEEVDIENPMGEVDEEALGNWAELLGTERKHPEESVDDFRTRLWKTRTLGKTHDTVIETVHLANKIVDYAYSENYSPNEILFISPANYRKLMIFIGLKDGDSSPWNIHDANMIQCRGLNIIARHPDFFTADGGEDVAVIAKPTSTLDLG